jgi:pimeloyl-ACP methyl ester carboxylesterase/protein-tyrosine phosphatase
MPTETDITSDSILLESNSTYERYSIEVESKIITYPSIRTFFHRNVRADELPKQGTALPLLVFVHGLGGSVRQFVPLIRSLVQCGPCLSIDLPGCGLSAFEPKAWHAYTTVALTKLVRKAIEEHRDKSRRQHVILIGHSMGCSLAALLASPASENYMGTFISGLICICPPATRPDEEKTAQYKRLLSIPEFAFNIWRRWDGRGGIESASVARYVGTGADTATKRMQWEFNQQSRTPVFRRMARGSLADFSGDTPIGGLPEDDVWRALDLPVYLIAGEADTITSPAEMEKIATLIDKTGKELPAERDRLDSLQPGYRGPVLRKTVLPAPASHALLYAPFISRTVAGLIEAFLVDHIDERLSLGWQLQQLAPSDSKWDVKNLEKWSKVEPVSEPIGKMFRAMKTMREIDDEHSPAKFVQQWGSRIRAVVDISHDRPVYGPQTLEKAGIEYHKFSTVSKQPPTNAEVKGFIELIDKIQASDKDTGARKRKLIGIHCHYGFNRTGYFIVCYLVERKGYRLWNAIEEFRVMRSPGIRHDHFIDALHVRYAIGMKKETVAEFTAA